MRWLWKYSILDWVSKSCAFSFSGISQRRFDFIACRKSFSFFRERNITTRELTRTTQSSCDWLSLIIPLLLLNLMPDKTGTNICTLDLTLSLGHVFHNCLIPYNPCVVFNPFVFYRHYNNYHLGADNYSNLHSLRKATIPQMIHMHTGLH